MLVFKNNIENSVQIEDRKGWPNAKQYQELYLYICKTNLIETYFRYIDDIKSSTYNIA